MTCNSVDSYKGFSVGDYFIIFRPPTIWSSGLEGKYPTDQNYPIIGVIKDIAVCEAHIAMNDQNDYGYSLTYLIEDNNISNNVKLIRKEKLIKLCGKH